MRKKKDPFSEIMKAAFPDDSIIVFPKNLFKNRNPFITDEEKEIEKRMDTILKLIEEELDMIQESFIQFQDDIADMVLYPYFKYAIDAFIKEAEIIENIVQNRNSQVSYDEMLSESYNISEYELRRRIFKAFLGKYSP